MQLIAKSKMLLKTGFAVDGKSCHCGHLPCKGLRVCKRPQDPQAGLERGMGTGGSSFCTDGAGMFTENRSFLSEL